MRNLKRVISLSCLVLLASCSGRQEPMAKYSSYFNFSAVASYSTFDRNSSFAEFQNISDATRNSIEMSIEQALDAQGLKYQSSEQADIIIGYHLIDKAGELKKYNRGVKFCLPCLQASNHPQQKQHWPMLPGSLVLDVVNVKNNRSVWRSVYPLNIQSQDNSFEVQDKIMTAISVMLSTMPSS